VPHVLPDQPDPVGIYLNVHGNLEACIQCCLDVGGRVLQGWNPSGEVPPARNYAHKIGVLNVVLKKPC
jgi:hypothetical protein